MVDVAHLVSFIVKRSPSGSARCKVCKVNIDRKQLRIGTQPRFDDHWGQSWFHYGCFWKKCYSRMQMLEHDPENPERIINFENLNASDKKRFQSSLRTFIKKNKFPSDQKDTQQKSKAEVTGGPSREPQLPGTSDSSENSTMVPKLEELPKSVQHDDDNAAESFSKEIDMPVATVKKETSETTELSQSASVSDVGQDMYPLGSDAYVTVKKVLDIPYVSIRKHTGYIMTLNDGVLLNSEQWNKLLEQADEIGKALRYMDEDIPPQADDIGKVLKCTDEDIPPPLKKRKSSRLDTK